MLSSIVSNDTESKSRELTRKEKELSRRDDEALEAVLSEMRRNRSLKNSIVQAAQDEDYENFSRIVERVLHSLGRTVDNFVNFVNNAIDWFKNL